MTLRAALTVISLLVTVLGTIASISGYHVFPIPIWGGIIFISLLIERWRYKATLQSKMSDDIATGEQFIDPETGTLTEVVYDHRTGERRYVRASRNNDEKA